MKFFLIIPLLVATTTHAFADPAPSARAYIKKYKQIAIAEEKRAGVPYPITMAQGIIESTCGTSRVARMKNNHFGIKRADNYKAYATVTASFVDHSNYFLRNRHYKRLLRNGNVNPKDWAQAIATSGYASDKHYKQKLMACIERNDLSDVDKQAR